ncbi:DUF4395 domain-containing protein [Lysinibacillus sp. 2017]|uniref:DUF4395 domain-containing protein n=1 Tax=unclassified Lysinibacillus TaxID=2636778 RepID=UPI000D5286F4|nr:MULTISPECIES: DUF4395 domain-containing protein [unclassified Lysinibacillus]AWE06113.1 DUF4395 domain-containing protein [Lysinibacillus sp. 2017]TGN30753.1 DUF4395 domain-containing protein [Lysinibacillus sp. S2017]
MANPISVPRPLVRVNQWTIFISVTLTWITGHYWILAIPLVANLLGIFTGFNPIMRFAKLFLKKDMNAYIPEDVQQQKFNATIACICLAGGLIGFVLDSPAIYYPFTIMVAVASFVAILGFCVGCFIHFQWKQFMYRRALKNS